MTTRDELLALAERVENSRSSRKLDREIFHLMCPDDAGESPDYTTNLAAAITLFDTHGRLLVRKVCAAALRARAAQEQE